MSLKQKYCMHLVDSEFYRGNKECWIRFSKLFWRYMDWMTTRVRVSLFCVNVGKCYSLLKYIIFHESTIWSKVGIIILMLSFRHPSILIFIVSFKKIRNLKPSKSLTVLIIIFLALNLWQRKIQRFCNWT